MNIQNLLPHFYIFHMSYTIYHEVIIMICKLTKTGTMWGYRIYLKKEDVEQLGFKNGDLVDVVIDRPKKKVE